ncbi:unnamed protein product, partial [Amoebophrya sp. A25]
VRSFDADQGFLIETIETRKSFFVKHLKYLRIPGHSDERAGTWREIQELVHEEDKRGVEDDD